MKHCLIFVLFVISLGSVGCSHVDESTQKETPAAPSDQTRVNNDNGDWVVSLYRVEAVDGHDYMLARGSGLAITHAAGCRKCSETATPDTPEKKEE